MQLGDDSQRCAAQYLPTVPCAGVEEWQKALRAPGNPESIWDCAWGNIKTPLSQKTVALGLNPSKHRSEHQARHPWLAAASRRHVAYPQPHTSPEAARAPRRSCFRNSLPGVRQAARRCTQGQLLRPRACRTLCLFGSSWHAGAQMHVHAAALHDAVVTALYSAMDKGLINSQSFTALPNGPAIPGQAVVRVMLRAGNAASATPFAGRPHAQAWALAALQRGT